MDIREKNAEYDAEVGNRYDKCEWCLNLIILNRYKLEKKIEGLNYDLFFCSIKCLKMFKLMLKQIHTPNEALKLEELKYNRLKQEMSKDFEQIQRRRGY